MRGMLVDNEFDLGDIVYLKTDVGIAPRIVSRILVRPGNLLYTLARGIDETDHYGLEITRDKKECLLFCNSQGEVQ